jgi:hypothetical protein
MSSDPFARLQRQQQEKQQRSRALSPSAAAAAAASPTTLSSQRSSLISTSSSFAGLLNKSLLSADEYDDGEDSNNNNNSGWVNTTYEDPCPPLAGFEFPSMHGNNNNNGGGGEYDDDDSSVATEDMASYGGSSRKLRNIPAVAWVLAFLARLLWLLLVLQVLLELPFTLLRWASIPSADKAWDAKRRRVAVVSPTGFAVALLLDAQGWEGFSASNTPFLDSMGVGAPLYQLVLGCGAVCSLAVFWLTVGSLDDHDNSRMTMTDNAIVSTVASSSPGVVMSNHGEDDDDNDKDDDDLPSARLEIPGSGGGGGGDGWGGGGGSVLPLPRIYPALTVFAFCSSVVWMDLIANEAVALMEAFGVALGVSTAILGLTVLAVGNR